MEGFALVFALAVAVERLVELLKTYFPDQYKNYLSLYLPAALGIGAAFGSNLDAFQLTGIHFSIPYVGYVVLGLVISKGSNYAHDFFSGTQAGTINLLAKRKEAPVPAPIAPSEAVKQEAGTNG